MRQTVSKMSEVYGWASGPMRDYADGHPWRKARMNVFWSVHSAIDSNICKGYLHTELRRRRIGTGRHFNNT